MNGVHDLGGMDGFGKVVPNPEDDAPFHEPWEGRVLAMSRVLQAAGAWNIDESRDAIERLPPHVYLAASYYQKWYLRNERLCLARGLVTREELEAGRASSPGKPLPNGVVGVDAIDRLMARGSYGRTPSGPARFAVGDRVRAKNLHPRSHTRLPRFVRGHAGLVERIQGCHVYPDSFVAEGREDPQWLYTVCFEGRELWGPESDPMLEVSFEAFEPYLEAA